MPDVALGSKKVNLISIFVWVASEISHYKSYWASGTDGSNSFYAPDHKMSGALCHGL
jgi:hypothetical protein